MTYNYKFDIIVHVRNYLLFCIVGSRWNYEMFIIIAGSAVFVAVILVIIIAFGWRIYRRIHRGPINRKHYLNNTCTVLQYRMSMHKHTCCDCHDVTQNQLTIVLQLFSLVLP